jgi:hypothetical protein
MKMKALEKELTAKHCVDLFCHVESTPKREKEEKFIHKTELSLRYGELFFSLYVILVSF